MSQTPNMVVQTTFDKVSSLQNVIFLGKMPPVHEVWWLCLGGQGVILTGIFMSNTPNSTGQTTFAKHSSLLNVIFPVKMPPVHEVW